MTADIHQEECTCTNHGHYRDSTGGCAICTCEYFMPEADATIKITDRYLNRDRPEVIIHRKAAVDLRSRAEEMDSLADWWASLEDHDHPNGSVCDAQNCYQRYKEF